MGRTAQDTLDSLVVAVQGYRVCLVVGVHQTDTYSCSRRRVEQRSRIVAAVRRDCHSSASGKVAKREMSESVGRSNLGYIPVVIRKDAGLEIADTGSIAAVEGRFLQ